MTEKKAINILGTPLEICSEKPMTGFFRDGCCHTNHLDHGTHVVCALVTDEFLQFSLSRGNDLITARPEYEFPGLKAGDHWCLCANRWKEAHEFGVAPPIKAQATHQKTLELIDIDILKLYFIN